MIYKEEIRDLFAVPDDYYLVQCISADFKMGKGIAVEFNKRFNMKNKLKKKYGDYKLVYIVADRKGHCLVEGRVFNLITKLNYYDKPTYENLCSALKRMRWICEINKIEKLAMPLIGCGLDRLKWDKVSAIIQDVFKDTNIEILVCKQ